MVIRFYWSAGVGHIYSHRAERPVPVNIDPDNNGEGYEEEDIEGDIAEGVQNEEESEDEEDSNIQQDAESEESEREDVLEDEEFLNLIEMYGEA